MDIDVHVTSLNWDDAEQLGFDEALERLVREFADECEPVSVVVCGARGDLQVSIVARLESVGAYDETMPPSISLHLDTGVHVVLDRRGFKSAEWLEQPGPFREVETALRFSIDERQIEFMHP